jgi:hypothetical protein
MPEMQASLIPTAREDWVAIWVVDCDCDSCKDNCAVVVSKWAQADEGIRKVRHDMP